MIFHLILQTIIIALASCLLEGTGTVLVERRLVTDGQTQATAYTALA